MANVLVFLLQMAQPRITSQLWLVPWLIPVRPWTAVTYMFLHGGIGHLFFNMLGLYFFGPRLEAMLGSRRFLTLYFLAGLSGALLSAMFPFTRYVPIVGASGAVFGVLLGFAWFWPRERIYLWGILAVEARVLVVALTALSLFGGFNPGRDGVAHFTHLGGFLGGWGYLVWMRSFGPAARFRRRAATPGMRISAAQDVARWKRIDPQALHPVNREEYERVIAKMGAAGPGALSPGEREFLDRFSPPS
jgi:membrane associated rhomboid family serine protease